MESPETDASMAWPMVLQAVVADVQLLPSKPFTPSTYQVVATAAGANAAAMAVRSKALSSSYFMISSIWLDPGKIHRRRAILVVHNYVGQSPRGARRFIARSRTNFLGITADEFPGVTAYDSRERRAVRQFGRCENQAEFPHIVVPHGALRCCEEQVPRLVEFVNVGYTGAIGIHRIRSRSGRLSDGAI